MQYRVNIKNVNFRLEKKEDMWNDVCAEIDLEIELEENIHRETLEVMINNEAMSAGLMDLFENPNKNKKRFDDFVLAVLSRMVDERVNEIIQVAKKYRGACNTLNHSKQAIAAKLQYLVDNNQKTT